ncbi:MULTISPECIES: glycosyltransferase [Microbacterium]|uniref:Rhamnosyl transferase n=1 Tax=Microbacterium saccharophilum TaxID=1213358 RepID=A0A7Z7D299_9MICO|nr:MULTISPECIES: glycosyltransferase [Microbacterium]SFI55755.1 Putative rhamnosyl transferase [Microbacterium saccharophilum]
MPASFDHVILTRYSVAFAADQEPADDDWLAYRWGFFRDACASSLATQSVRNVTWLVFFDARSPEWLREEVAELSPGPFTPVWLDEPWSLHAIQAAVESVTRSPYLITTRLDSDDALAVRFVEDVQARFSGQDGLYVNFLRGVQVERGGQLFRYDAPSNPFISYIEKRRTDTPPRTVFQDFGHGRSIHHGPLLNVIGPPRWMQVIHGGNVLHDVRGLRERPAAANREFDITLPFRTHVGPVPFTREWIVSLGRLAVLCMRQPARLRERVRATGLRFAGTRVWAQRG